MSGSHSSPSLVQSSRTKLFRPALESSSARAKMHREHKQTMKELEKLEKQASVAVSNVDMNRHAIKLLQQQIERRRSETDAPSIQRSPARKNSLQERRTILHNQTIVTVPPSSEYGVRTSSHAGQTEQPVEDDAVQKQEEDEELHQAELIPPTEPHASPYISSPLLYARRNQLPKPFRSPVPSLALVSSSPSRTEEEASLRPVTVHARPGTASKNKLKRVDLGGLGLNASSSGPESFKHFYSSGSQYASAVFDASSVEDDMEGDDSVKKRGQEELVEPQTLEELFEDIRRCRYVRIYQPRMGKRMSQAWQFDRKRTNTTYH